MLTMVAGSPDPGVAATSSRHGGKPEVVVNGSSNHRRKPSANGDATARNPSNTSHVNGHRGKSPSAANYDRSPVRDLSPNRSGNGGKNNGGPAFAVATTSPPRKRHTPRGPFNQSMPAHASYGRMALVNPWELSPAADIRLTAELESLYQSLLPAGDNIHRRAQFKEKLQGIFNREFPDRDITVHLFGSSVSGLAASYSDVDVCLETKWDDRINGVGNMFVLAGVLRKSGMSIGQIVNSSKVPVCRFFDPEHGIYCDINVNNTLALKNTELVRSYVAIDPRVRKLCILIKHWAKRRALNDAAKGGTLSSYCWVMMIIHFLQTRTPAVLPCLQSMYDGPPDMSSGEVDTAFYTDIDGLKARKFGANNTESLGGLFFRFFRRFAIEFDYETMVVSVRKGEFLRKSEKGWDVDMARHNNFLAVEEPFIPSRNLANSADFYSVVGLRGEFRRAFDLLLHPEGTLDAVNARYVFPGDSAQASDMDMHGQFAGSLFPGKGYRNTPQTPKKQPSSSSSSTSTLSSGTVQTAATNGTPGTPSKGSPNPASTTTTTNGSASLEPAAAAGDHHSRSSSLPGMEFAVGKDGVPVVVQATTYHHVNYRFGPVREYYVPFYPLAPDFNSMPQLPFFELAAYYQAVPYVDRQNKNLAPPDSGGGASRRHSSVDRMGRNVNSHMSKALRAQAMSETASPQWRAGTVAESNGARSEASEAGSSPPPSDAMGASVSSIGDVVEIVLPPAATRRASNDPSISDVSLDSSSSSRDSNSVVSRTPSPPPEKPTTKTTAADVVRISPTVNAQTSASNSNNLNSKKQQQKKTLLWSNSSVKASSDMVMGADDLFTPAKPAPAATEGTAIKEKGNEKDKEKRRTSASSATATNGKAAGKLNGTSTAAAVNGTAGSSKPAAWTTTSSSSITSSSSSADKEKDKDSRPKQKSATFNAASSNSFASLESKSPKEPSPGHEPVVRAMSWAAVVGTKGTNGNKNGTDKAANSASVANGM